MAILKIARMGHPVLLRRAIDVADPTGPETRRLLADMFETMEDAGGVGLAAPQVHVPLRLFVYKVPEERSAGAEPLGHSALINPVIEPLGEEWNDTWEGCLSIPGLRGLVRRPARIRYSGRDAAGTEIGGEASGFRAVVMQHEYDHLNGTLYPMRMTDLTRLGFNEELARFPPDAVPAEAGSA